MTSFLLKKRKTVEQKKTYRLWITAPYSDCENIIIQELIKLNYLVAPLDKRGITTVVGPNNLSIFSVFISKNIQFNNINDELINLLARINFKYYSFVVVGDNTESSWHCSGNIIIETNKQNKNKKIIKPDYLKIIK